MNPFEMVAIIVVAVMIASVFRSRFGAHRRDSLPNEPHENHETARSVVEQLEAAGISSGNVSIVGRNGDGDTNAAEGAGIGAVVRAEKSASISSMSNTSAARRSGVGGS